MTAATCTCGIQMAMPGCDARSVALAHEAAAKGSETFSATLKPGCGARLAHDLFEGCKIALFNAAERFRSCPAATVTPEGDAGEWPPNDWWQAVLECIARHRKPPPKIQHRKVLVAPMAMLSVCDELRELFTQLPPRPIPPPSDAACLELINTIYQHSYVESDSAGSYTAIRAAFAAWAKGGQR